MQDVFQCLLVPRVQQSSGEVFYLFEGWGVLQNLSCSSVQILLCAKNKKSFIKSYNLGQSSASESPFPGQRCKEMELCASRCKFSIETGAFLSCSRGSGGWKKTSFVFPRQQGPGFVQSAFVWGCVKPSMCHSFCFSC